MTPMGLPVRTLKAAIDFLALVITGFWPTIWVRSFTAASSVLGFWIASPMPILTTTFSRRGTCMTFARFRSFIRAGTNSLLYRSRKRACATSRPPCSSAAGPGWTYRAVNTDDPPPGHAIGSSDLAAFPRFCPAPVVIVDNQFTAIAALPGLAAVGQEGMADTHGPVALGADHHHLRGIQRRLDLDDAGLPGA